jgi:hypothetical protein
VSLIHELPRLIKDYRLEQEVKVIAEQADQIVFAARQVKDGFLSLAGQVEEGRCLIRPQGSYKAWHSAPEKNRALRTSLGLGARDKLIINVGYADARKGFDIFQSVAKALCRRRDDVHFLWLGAAAPEVQNWLLDDFEESQEQGTKRFHMLPFTDDPVPVYEAADLFFLSSREDPFPTVVLEAMRAGLPIVGLQGGGGFVDLVAEHGKLASRSDIDGIIKAIESLLDLPKAERERAAGWRRETIARDFRFDDYAFDLLRLLQPGLAKVSVVVPNYNYEQFLPARLESIYAQTHPLFEVLALDDVSTDESLGVLARYAEQTGNMFRLEANAVNSGSGYRQWDKGAQMARGDYVWMAEADDLAAPEFLGEALALLESSGAAFVFCDSRQVDEYDKLLGESYRWYFETLEKGAFARSFVMEGPEFVRRFLSVKNIIMNVSGVLWRRDAFLTALEATRAEHETLRVASDWKMYVIAALRCGPVGYVAKPLNTHRRHSASVTHARNAEQHYAEIVAVQDFVAGEVKLDEKLVQKREAYRVEVREYLGLPKRDTPKRTSKKRSAQ